MNPLIRRLDLRTKLVIALLLAVIVPSIVVGVILVRGGIPGLQAEELALFWILTFAVLVVVFSYFIYRYLARPLEALRRGAEMIGAGNLSCRVELHTNDEFEDLARSLNQMAENLQRSRRLLEEEHGRAVAAAREARVLYRVSQALVSTLELSERLDLIAENLAEVCRTDRTMIWLLEDNHLVPYASHGLSDDDQKLFDSWEIHLEEATRATRAALDERRPVVVRDTSEDQRIPLELAERMNVKSVLVLPFIFEDEPIGLAVTYQHGKYHKFTKYQINLAQAIGAQAAVAIENSKVYERVHRISEVLQRSFLPAVPPSIGDFDIADKYVPAFTEAEIGGDFYDLISLSPTRTALVIADVSGKGLSSAVHTALIKYTLRAYAIRDERPEEAVRHLNQAVYRFIGGEAFVTLFYGVLDIETLELSYVNAGHELPLLYGEDRGICMRLTTTGTALGIIPDYDYGLERIQFIPGDSLLMYTDGASEARRGREFLGIEGLEAMFCAAAYKEVHDMVDDLEKNIRDFAGGELHDDLALLVVKYRRPRQERFSLEFTPHSAL